MTSAARTTSVLGDVSRSWYAAYIVMVHATAYIKTTRRKATRATRFLLGSESSAEITILMPRVTTTTCAKTRGSQVAMTTSKRPSFDSPILSFFLHIYQQKKKFR